MVIIEYKENVHGLQPVYIRDSMQIVVYKEQNKGCTTFTNWQKNDRICR